MAKWSQDLQLKVMRANKIINAARKRVAEGGDYGTALMEQALEFAEKQIEFIHGKGATGFSLSGLSESQLDILTVAVEDVLSRKTLTKKGMIDVERKSMVGFFGKPFNRITNKEKRMFRILVKNGTLDKVKEISFIHTSMLNSAQLIAPKMSAEEMVSTVEDWVNNKDGAREGAGSGEAKGNFYDYIRARYLREIKNRQNGGNKES